MGVEIQGQVCEKCNRTCSVSVLEIDPLELGNCPYCNHKQTKFNDDNCIGTLQFIILFLALGFIGCLIFSSIW